MIIQTGHNGLIIFDGACGVCSTFVGKKQKFFEKYGFKVIPLQTEGVLELTNLPEEILMQAIHVVTPTGQIYKGADFFYYLSSKVWWLKPLFYLLKIKLFKFIFAKAYSFIAKRRNGISKVCGWNGGG